MNAKPLLQPKGRAAAEFAGTKSKAITYLLSRTLTSRDDSLRLAATLLRAQEQAWAPLGIGKFEQSEVEPGLFCGTSTFTGEQTLLRLIVDGDRFRSTKMFLIKGLLECS